MIFLDKLSEDSDSKQFLVLSSAVSKGVECGGEEPGGWIQAPFIWIPDPPNVNYNVWQITKPLGALVLHV